MNFFHSHVILYDKCKGSLKCIKSCPTKALRHKHDKLVFYDDLCVDCGECINVCPENVFVPVIDEIHDFDKFDYKFVIPSRILYTQFSPDIHPLIIHDALVKAGFDEVIDISNNINTLSYAISEHIKIKSDGKPIISTFCPALVRLIQVNYPNLMEMLSPFEVARELTAREAKQRISKEKGIDSTKIGAIYLTPCPAKVVSIKQPAEKEKSWLDGAIAISDIYKIILPEVVKNKNKNIGKERKEYFYYGKGYGMLSQVLDHFDSEKCLSVVGIENIKMVLNDIEDAKLVNVDYLEAFTCSQKCNGGAFCVENPYIARHNAFILGKNYTPKGTLDKDAIDKKYKDGYYFTEEQVLPRKTRALSSDLATSIKRMKQKERILSKLPNKDCGLCGAPNCETFAEDCSMGYSDLTDCVFFNLSQNT